MDRVNRIWEHPRYQCLLKKLQDLEAERIFCRHDIEHFLAVARLIYIYVLRERIHIDPEIIYAAALLHDIGRPAEYERGIPHDEAGAEMAEELLTQCGFSREETEEICSAILSHRKNAGEETTLGRLLRQADKASRCCFSCNAKKECKWPEEKMNLKVDC